MNITFIRHTTPAISKGICYGQLDIDVEKNKFSKEAHFVRLKLGVGQFDAVYSSPLLRCVKLAEYLFKDSYSIHNELKEVDFGEWENKPWSKIRGSYARRWMNNYVYEKAPNGESFYDLSIRVSGFLEQLLEKDVEKVAIVTHAGVIRAALCFLDGTDLQASFSNYPLKYGEVVTRIVT